MPAVEFLPLDAGEVTELADLAGEIWRLHYPGIIGPEQIAYMLAQRYAPAVILDSLARGEWWDTAREGGRLVGFAHAHVLDEGDWKLDKLYVHPSRQRRGIGGRLIDRAARHARALGGRRLVLRVNRQNAQAIAAYRKHGFRVEREVMEDIGQGYVMDDFQMMRDL